MKRKFKLFATVASLCLSVALMAFGVYAATTVTYTVSGTVSFSSLEVLSTWDAHAYKANGTTEWGTTTKGEYSTTAGQASATNDATFPSITFATNDATVIYEITCTNDGSTPFYVHVADEGNTLVAIADQMAVTVEHGTRGEESDSLSSVANIGALSTATVQAGQTYVWKITVTLEDFTKALDATTQGTLKIQFTADYTNA